MGGGVDWAESTTGYTFTPCDGPKQMRDVLLISLAFSFKFSQHLDLEEPERGGCPLGQKCQAEIDVFLNPK